MTLLADTCAIDSGRRALRRFGITLGIVGLTIGTVLWSCGVTSWLWVGMAASVVIAVGLVLPSLLLPLHKIWMALSLVLGWIMTRVILIVVFYLVLTPIGLVARLLGKRFLQPGPDTRMDSYWIPRESDDDRTRFERQF